MSRDLRTSLSCLLMAWVVLVIAAGADAGSGAQAQARWKVVYEHYEGGGGAFDTELGIDILTSERGGRPLSLVRQARGADTFYTQPAVSPDGQYVAYITWEPGRPGRGAMHVVRADGSAQRRLATGVIKDFVWSVDSSSLAFTQACGYDWEGGCRRGRIDTIRRDGTHRRLLVRPHDLGRKADIDLQDWSREGDLLYVVHDRGQEQLYAVSETSGANPTALANNREDGLGAASWSSDGRLVSSTRRCLRDGYCELVLTTRAGQFRRTLVHRGPVTGPSWSASWFAPTWIPGSQQMLVLLRHSGHRHAEQTRVVGVAGESRLFAKAHLWGVAIDQNGARVVNVAPGSPGYPSLLVIRRLDGSTLERVRLPRNFYILYEYDYDLWVG